MSDYTGQVVFMGAGPYWLPTARSATAIGGSAGVEMTLFCVIPHEGDEVHPVRVRMTHEVGRDLAGQLIQASIDAEFAK